MNEWGRQTYGDPCRECAFGWGVDVDEAVLLITGIPPRLVASLAQASGNERHPQRTWSVTAYVAHIGDNLRIWAERIASISLGGPTSVAGYDENKLAAVRTYDRLSLAGALWSLERATRDWAEAVTAAPRELTMFHPERGGLSLDDVVASNAHDAAHHVWDIDCSLPR